MVDLVLLISRIVLAAVIGIAGAGKLADLPGSRRAVAGFGVPVRLAAPLGTAIPFVELGLALALLPAATARWAALVSLLLLLGFTTGMVVAMRRGDHPDCHCFGVIHSAPVSRSTVLRNVAFALVSGLVVALGWEDAGPGVLAWLDDASRGDAVLVGVGLAIGAMLIGGTLVVTHLVQRIDALQERLRWLEPGAPLPPERAESSAVDEATAILQVPVGTPAPAFVATSLAGTVFDFEQDLHRGHEFLLVFVNPGCSACERLLPHLALWISERGDRLKVLVISHGGTGENLAKASRADFPADHYLLQDGREVSEAFGVVQVPVALHVDADGALASNVVGGVDRTLALLDSLTDRVVGQAPAASNPVSLNRIRAAFGVGDRLPVIAGTSAEGVRMDVPTPGRRTLLVFWSPECPFCQRLLHDLRSFETGVGDDVSVMLLVRKGMSDATRAQGISSAIVEDDGGIRARYEVTGTPVMALVTPEGALSEPMAFGLGAAQILLRQAFWAPSNGARG